MNSSGGDDTSDAFVIGTVMTVDEVAVVEVAVVEVAVVEVAVVEVAVVSVGRVASVVVVVVVVVVAGRVVVTNVVVVVADGDQTRMANSEPSAITIATSSSRSPRDHGINSEQHLPSSKTKCSSRSSTCDAAIFCTSLSVIASAVSNGGGTVAVAVDDVVGDLVVVVDVAVDVAADVAVDVAADVAVDVAADVAVDVAAARQLSQAPHPIATAGALMRPVSTQCGIRELATIIHACSAPRRETSVRGVSVPITDIIEAVILADVVTNFLHRHLRQRSPLATTPIFFSSSMSVVFLVVWFMIPW